MQAAERKAGEEAGAPDARRSEDSRTPRQPADRPSDATMVESDELFAGRREIQIRHAGQVYRLRVTRNGKLILNK